jgi:predicted kinase
VPPGRRVLVLVTGLPGTGKSTVAEAIARRLGASVLAHDWAMSGLRPYGEIQAVLHRMQPSGHRVVGWSVLNALARLQLRHGRSVVLDGVARQAEILGCRKAAASENAALVVVATHCSDLSLHRSRVVGRQRDIPDWYEVDWSQVETSRSAWQGPDQADLTLDAADSWAENLARLEKVFG